MLRISVLLAATALAALPGLSCGLIDSDVTDFTLKLPEKDFNVDTADWMLTVQGSTVPSIPCPPAECTVAADQFCADGACTSTCDANMECQAIVDVTVFQQFDLANEAMELDAIDSQAVISVEVETIAFRIEENTLNVASPPLKIYLAPQGVSDPNGGVAVEIGTLAPVAAAQTGSVDIVLTPSGKQVMEQFMEDFRTPFTVIIAGSAAIQAGDPVPEGRMSGVVTVSAHAGL